MAKKFEMPYCSLGMTVLYFPDESPSTRPITGIVTNVSPDALTVSVIDGVHEYMNPKTGVRHRDDPRHKTSNNQQGCWEHTEFNEHLLGCFGPPKRPAQQEAKPDPMGSLTMPKPARQSAPNEVTTAVAVPATEPQPNRAA